MEETQRRLDEIERDLAEPCERCNGQGIVGIDARLFSCMRCGGSGLFRDAEFRTTITRLPERLLPQHALYCYYKKWGTLRLNVVLPELVEEELAAYISAHFTKQLINDETLLRIDAEIVKWLLRKIEEQNE